MSIRDPNRTFTLPSLRVARAARRSAWLYAIGVVGWLLAAAAGIYWLNTPDRPGIAANPPDEWPTESTLARTRGRSTLLVFIHPHCPCTRRTLTELSRVMDTHSDRAEVIAVLYSPDGVTDHWTETNIRAQAAGIRGVKAVVDDHGDCERQRFGVSTSGQVLLYDAAGRLRFRGGITPDTLHAWSNTGRAALESILRGEPTPAVEAPVFGCPMCFEPSQEGR